MIAPENRIAAYYAGRDCYGMVAKAKTDKEVDPAEVARVLNEAVSLRYGQYAKQADIARGADLTTDSFSKLLTNGCKTPNVNFRKLCDYLKIDSDAAMSGKLAEISGEWESSQLIEIAKRIAGTALEQTAIGVLKALIAHPPTPRK